MLERALAPARSAPPGQPCTCRSSPLACWINQSCEPCRGPRAARRLPPTRPSRSPKACVLCRLQCQPALRLGAPQQRQSRVLWPGRGSAAQRCGTAVATADASAHPIVHGTTEPSTAPMAPRADACTRALVQLLQSGQPPGRKAQAGPPQPCVLFRSRRELTRQAAAAVLDALSAPRCPPPGSEPSVQLQRQPGGRPPRLCAADGCGRTIGLHFCGGGHAVRCCGETCRMRTGASTAPSAGACVRWRQLQQRLLTHRDPEQPTVPLHSV